MTKEKKFSMMPIHYVIILLFMFGFRFIPPFGGLNEVSMQVIGVFVGVLYGWITVEIVWPAVLGVVAFGMTDYCTMSELFQSAFASQTAVMILGLLFLAAFVQQAELTDVIVDFLLTRKSAKGRPFMILFYFLFAGFLAAVLSQPVAVLVIFLQLFYNIMKRTGMAPYSKAVPCFFVGSAFAIVIGDIALPFKAVAILGIGAYESITGETMNLLSFSLYMFPMCVLLIILYVLFCKYVLRIDLSALNNYEHKASDEKLSFRKKVSLIGVVVAMIVLLIPSILPDSWEITVVVDNMGLGGLSLLVCAILMLIRIDGEPLMDMTKTAAYFPWSVYFIIVVLFPVADALSSDVVGLKQILSSAAVSFLTGKPTLIIILLVVLLAAVITNFANNVVICSLFVTIVCFMGDSLPLNPAIMTCLCILASNLSMFFPAANPMNAILFAQKHVVRFKDELVIGLISCLFLCVVTATFGYWYGTLFF